MKNWWLSETVKNSGERRWVTNINNVFVCLSVHLFIHLSVCHTRLIWCKSLPNMMKHISPPEKKVWKDFPAERAEYISRLSYWEFNYSCNCRKVMMWKIMWLILNVNTWKQLMLWVLQCKQFSYNRSMVRNIFGTIKGKAMCHV